MAEEKFELVSNYAPTGDQPQAIAQLVEGVQRGDRCQTLLGVTGSGKTFTMANVIAQCNRPTLVLAHNKTLAAQLCTEFRSFFPNNAVEYFVSYYDYYQPEAYIPSTDTYIEKDSAINDEIDRLRHSATAALSERRDVIIVASVSCIYSLGDPIDYRSMVISLRPGMQMERDELCKKLVTLQYERNDVNFVRNKFRVHGDIVDIYLAYMSELAIRVEFFGDEIDRITEFNPLTGSKQNVVKHVAIFPASHYIVSAEKKAAALEKIRAECDAQVKQFTAEGKLIEAQRIAQRTNYDIEMLNEVGICKGIENYSAVLSGRAPGSMPTTLLDYFPEDFLLFVDESHVTLPQVRAMYGGDYARKKTLVEYGFRLPSAFDNRPLKFEEVESKLNQMIFVSATPGEYERRNSSQVAQQVIRPTGLLDPVISVRPVEGQVVDLLGEINARIQRQERVLVTTLTKKMAEDLTDYLTEQGIKVKYMHHEVDTFERMEIIKDLRLGSIDVVVGINLLREGLETAGRDVALDERHDLAVAVGVGFDDLFPRPHLVERADHEAHQHGHRDVVPVFEQPRQQVRKADDARRGAHDENHDDGNVQIAHGLHDELVLAQQEQDEGARNAGQDHGADGDGARQHDEPPRVGGLGRRGDGDPPCGGRADQACGDSPDVPVPDLPGHEQRRGDDQPEEERPDGNRVVREQVGHQPGQRENRNGDAQQHGQQETSVDMTPELAEAEFQQQLERPFNRRCEDLYNKPYKQYGNNNGQYGM